MHSNPPNSSSAAYNELLNIHKLIRAEFAKLDDMAIDAIYADFKMSTELKQQLRTHGDGFTLRSLPQGADAWRDAGALVIVAMNSPLLDTGSDFSPFKQLPDIEWWRKKKGLRHELAGLRLQFLVWENCAVHGKNTADAQKSRTKLHKRGMRDLFHREKTASAALLVAWCSEAIKKALPVILVTNKNTDPKGVLEDLRDVSGVELGRANLFDLPNEPCPEIIDMLKTVLASVARRTEWTAALQ